MSELNYGGQAVMEGVMMRAGSTMAVAVRAPSGKIILHREELSSRLYTARWARLPFLRGTLRLWDALVLGSRALLFSANVALEEEEGAKASFGGATAWGTVILGLALGVGIFFLAPAFLAGLVARYIPSTILLNLGEGLLRLALVIGYIGLIGRIPDIRRLFAYHGAEHQVINAYEKGAELTPEGVADCSVLHPRCGTGFLLVVAVVALLVFSLLGRPPLPFRLLSRVILIPLVAAISYEFIRFAARHSTSSLWKALLAPCLALQRLSTRSPDSSMQEVALAALKAVMAPETERSV